MLADGSMITIEHRPCSVKQGKSAQKITHSGGAAAASARSWQVAELLTGSTS